MPEPEQGPPPDPCASKSAFTASRAGPRRSPPPDSETLASGPGPGRGPRHGTARAPGRRVRPGRIDAHGPRTDAIRVRDISTAFKLLFLQLSSLYWQGGGGFPPGELEVEHVGAGGEADGAAHVLGGLVEAAQLPHVLADPHQQLPPHAHTQRERERERSGPAPACPCRSASAAATPRAAHARTRSSARTSAYTLARRQARTCARAQTHTHIEMHTRARSHTHTHTHTHTPSHTHTHTHTPATRHGMDRSSSSGRCSGRCGTRAGTHVCACAGTRGHIRVGRVAPTRPDDRDREGGG